MYQNTKVSLLLLAVLQVQTHTVNQTVATHLSKPYKQGSNGENPLGRQNSPRSTAEAFIIDFF